MSEVDDDDDDESVGYNLQGRVIKVEVVTTTGGLSRDVEDDDSLDHATVGACFEGLTEEEQEEEEQPATGDVEGSGHEVGTS